MTSKIGVFGGTFNPVHFGHLNSAKTVKALLNLDQMIIVPNAQNPLKEKVERPNPQERLRMVEFAFESLGGETRGYFVHDFEVLRGQESYMVDTLSFLQSEYPESQLFVIVGADQVQDFPKWKRYEEILNLAKLVVTTRPGYDLSEAKSVLNSFAKTKSYKFVELDDEDIAATDIRNRIARGEDVSKLLPVEVIKYIKDNEFYLSGEK